MFSKALNVAAMALAASTVVSGQTFTLCDPTKKDCPPDPALATSVDLNLATEPREIFENLAGTKVEYDAAKGAVFPIRKEGDSPTMQSYKYIFFGRVDMVLQAAPGAGIVTSVVLQSDTLDEIDFEWVGGNNAQVQTNYFSKGDTTTYDRGAHHPVNNPLGEFHTYSIEWTKEHLQWIIDGVVIRTLTYADAKGGTIYPQTPMQVKFGTWIAGRKDASQGTIDWAGGLTNFAEGPFLAYYKSIKITDYAGGVTGAKQYVYGDRSGTWQSIKVDTVNGGSVGPKPSSSGAPLSTKSETASVSKSTTLSTSTTAGPDSSTTSTPATGNRVSTTSSGNAQTSAPTTPSAAGHVVLTLRNLGLAGAALCAAQFFL